VISNSKSGSEIGISNLGMDFESKSGTVIALHDINLNIARGEFVCVVGPSGCGKSTLLNLVAGLRTPSTGAVSIDGQNVSQPQTNVGIVFQRDVLLEWRTVLQNVLFQIEMRGLDPSDYLDRAKELLSMLGLEEFLHHRPSELSGGMRQRVAICRALIHDPPLLLMDEPFGALDALTREQLMIELARLWQSTSKTVLFITHSIQEALFLGDRVIVVSKRPGEVMKDIRVDIARPRKLSESILEFSTYTSEVRGLLGIQD